MNRVKLGFVALTGVPKTIPEVEYLEWHAMRHMPEQFTVPGVLNAQRWHSTPACRAQRAAQADHLADVENVVSYLLGDPIDVTLREFQALNKRLNETGKFLEPSPFLMLGAYEVLQARAAVRTLISDEAVPWRPNLGIFIVVEQLDESPDADQFETSVWETEIPALLEERGVAGVWLLGAAPQYLTANQATGRYLVTLCYLDEDPVSVGASLRPRMEARWVRRGVEPIFAGPFESVLQWNWQRFGALGAGRASV